MLCQVCRSVIFRLVNHRSRLFFVAPRPRGPASPLSMGFLSICLGSPASIEPAPPGGSPQRLQAPAPAQMTMESAEFLVGTLTQGQVVELRAAFDQYDVNGNGNMYARSHATPRACVKPRGMRNREL